MIHCVNPFNSSEQRFARARLSWGKVRVVPVTSGYRTGRMIGDKRDVPFLRDLIDLAWKGNDDEELLMFTNADAVLTTDALEIIMDGYGPCVYSHRRNYWRPLRVGMTSEENMARGTPFNGVDLFVIARWYYRELVEGNKFPDILLGYQGWDYYIKSIGTRLPVDIVAHEMHGEPYWKSNDSCVGQIWNKILVSHTIGRERCRQLGIDEWLDLTPDDYLNAKGNRSCLHVLQKTMALNVQLPIVIGPTGSR